MRRTLRVFIADDNIVYCHEVKHLVAKMANMTVIGEAASKKELLRCLRVYRIDLLVLDISMPDCCGLDILQEVREVRPDLPILILSFHSEVQFAVRAIKLGATGYVTKGSPARELKEAMLEAAAGRRYICESLLELMTESICSDFEGVPHKRLSYREFQLMQMMANEMTPIEIAEELMIDVKTVEAHRERIMLKMEMKSRSELARYATKHNLF